MGGKSKRSGKSGWPKLNEGRKANAKQTRDIGVQAPPLRRLVKKTSPTIKKPTNMPATTNLAPPANLPLTTNLAPLANLPPQLAQPSTTPFPIATSAIRQPGQLPVPPAPSSWGRCC